MSASDAYTDVVELCAMLQCLGFSVKSLDTAGETNSSQNGANRTVIINCQSSGLHVVLESGDVTCSCPSSASQQNSGFWQVSGMAGGKQLNKEYGSALLGSLPRTHRERLTRQLHDMVRCIQENNESDVEISKERENAGNRSASMIELKTPEKRQLQLKSETPKRYRSLDTLTGVKQAESLPPPGALQKQLTSDASDANADKKVQSMCQRQSTYTLSSTSGSMRRTNKTSSPIQAPPIKNILDTLVSAERAAEDVLNKLSSVIREISDEGKHDSSMSSLVLDVSKISVLKGGECSKLQFTSSPNLSGLDTVKEDLCNRLKRGESASTSNLASSKSISKDVPSKLRRISPNFFKLKRDSPGLSKIEKLKSEDKKSSKLSNLLKPRTVVPPRTSKSITDASPNLSASRKKFSHVKSTIPRPASKKD